ncbi:hypothetical protein V9T40_002955 [Parthenolecanium corni]|uniref:Uncharacterized protein n=1 Tax=Parthenolecanium corni TaxID=536013 RepID=A0AAN9TVD0_9HEMI
MRGRQLYIRDSFFLPQIRRCRRRRRGSWVVGRGSWVVGRSRSAVKLSSPRLGSARHSFVASRRLRLALRDIVSADSLEGATVYTRLLTAHGHSVFALDNIAWIASALSWPYRTTLSTSLM